MRLGVERNLRSVPDSLARLDTNCTHLDRTNLHWAESDLLENLLESIALSPHRFLGEKSRLQQEAKAESAGDS